MKQTDYVNIGQIELIDERQHEMSPARVTRVHSNGITKFEWFVGMAMAGGKSPQAAVMDALTVIKELEKAQ